MTDDLVKRLRAGTGDGLRAYDWMNEAADRIEKLEAALKPFADLAYESDGEMVVLPIYDIYTDEWLIQLEDASFKRISHEEYKKLYVFKTRYDVGR